MREKERGRERRTERDGKRERVRERCRIENKCQGYIHVIILYCENQTNIPSESEDCGS
jgi:hypothetical protein